MEPYNDPSMNLKRNQNHGCFSFYDCWCSITTSQSCTCSTFYLRADSYEKLTLAVPLRVCLGKLPFCFCEPSQGFTPFRGVAFTEHFLKQCCTFFGTSTLVGWERHQRREQRLHNSDGHFL